MRALLYAALFAVTLTGALAAQGRSVVGVGPAAGGMRSGPADRGHPGGPGMRGWTRGPRTPASTVGRRLPGPPGVSVQRGWDRDFRLQGGRFRQGRGFGGPRGLFGRGFGFGGIFGFDGDFDYDPGDFEDERDEERREAERELRGSRSRNSYVVRFPASRSQATPSPRVYDVRETADGRVEMTPIVPGQSGAAAPAVAADYWLIAIQGGRIYAVERFEQRDQTLRFDTLDGNQFVIPAAEVDRALTRRLNADLGRSVDLR